MLASVISRGRSNICQTLHQQVRHSSRKQHALQKGFYGVPPLYNQDRYDEAVDSGELKDYQFKKVRFALASETNSVFHDDLSEIYLRHMMNDGRRWLMDQLLHEGYYEIKMIQYKKWRKQQEKKAAKAKEENTNKTSSSSSSVAIGDGEEEEEEEIDTNPVSVFKKAIDNAKPAIITEKIRRGGATYQVPMPVTGKKSLWFAMKWYNDTIEERPKPRVKHFPEVFAQDIVDGSLGRGLVVKKRDDVHRLAHANKAYAHYRWG